MKVKCYCCEKLVDSNKANGVFTTTFGTRYFCDAKICQKVFDDAATRDEYIYDESRNYE